MTIDRVRRNLIVKRAACGADTYHGRVISDLIELLDEPRTEYVRMLIASKMNRLKTYQ